MRRRKGRLRTEDLHLRQRRLSGSCHGRARCAGAEHRRNRGAQCEYTLDNFATLSTHGTSDSVILDLMLNKHLPETE